MVGPFRFRLTFKIYNFALTIKNMTEVCCQEFKPLPGYDKIFQGSSEKQA